MVRFVVSIALLQQRIAFENCTFITSSAIHKVWISAGVKWFWAREVFKLGHYLRLKVKLLIGELKQSKEIRTKLFQDVIQIIAL
jgi:hypothetical protein